MNGPDLELLLGSVPQLETGQIVTALLLSLALGLVVALAYRFSVSGRVVSPALQSSLVLLAMVASMVMMVIGNNIARAFSLVGALAIVRFRTRLRSSWDISFVFFALVVGIACGVMAFEVAVLGTAIVGLAVLALQVVPLAGLRAGNTRSLRCDVASYEGVEGDVSRALETYLERCWLVEARTLRFGEALSLRYRVVLRDPGEIAAMLRQLGMIEGVERVVIDHGEERDEGAE